MGVDNQKTWSTGPFDPRLYDAFKRAACRQIMENVFRMKDCRFIDH